MPYSVPQNIDPNKIFLVNFSELEGRWDPQFYTPKNLGLVRSITKRVKWKRLKELVKFSTETWNQKDFFEEEFPYGEISEIDTSNGDIRNIHFIEIAKAPSRAKMIVHNGDIIISTTRPTRGAISLVNTKLPILIASTGFSVIREVDENVILRTALFIILRLEMCLLQMGQRSSGGNYPAITQDELGKIIIPVPPLHIQQQIVNVYNAALSQRKKKLSESKAKLASIDQYLLGELGITLPEDSHEKTFIVNYKDVDGGKLDPKSYCNNVKNLKNAITDSSFEKQPLSTFIVNESSGDWGEDIERKDLDFANYTKCLVLRATEFDNRYNLKLDNSHVKYRYISNVKLKRMNVKPNDLIIEKSGGSEDQPVGRIGILTREILDNETIAFSNFLHKITVTGIDPQYLFFYLKTMHNIGLTDSMQSQTNGIRNLIMSEYKRQNIIVPDKKTQTKIADHISAIRAEAKALEQEADAILEQAKKKVEEMILG